MSMTVHGASSDEGTSMAALDLKAGKGAPVMWPPNNENLGRFSNSQLDEFVFAFLSDNLACSAPDSCGFPVHVLHEQSSCLQELEIFVFAFFSDTSSLAVQCSVGTYVVASCVCISVYFRVLFACGRGRVCVELVWCWEFCSYLYCTWRHISPTR